MDENRGSAPEWLKFEMPYEFSLLKWHSLIPPFPPFFKGGERGNFCRCLGQKRDVQKYASLF